VLGRSRGARRHDRILEAFYQDVDLSKLFSMAKFPIILLSGNMGQRIADRLWSQVLGSGAPDTAQEDICWTPADSGGGRRGETLYKIARMVVDRGLRTAVARSTGRWPGGGP
jgi:hypothetical protein